MEEIAHEENNFEKRESKRTSYPCQIQNTQEFTDIGWGEVNTDSSNADRKK